MDFKHLDDSDVLLFFVAAIGLVGLAIGWYFLNGIGNIR